MKQGILIVFAAFFIGCNTHSHVRELNATAIAGKAVKEGINRTQAQRITVRLVYDRILQHEIRNPKRALAQVIQETGWLKSDICLTAKNLFGMKLPRTRETTANGSYKGHARYESYNESVKDYKLWQQSTGGNLNNYATPEYQSEIEKLMNQL